MGLNSIKSKTVEWCSWLSCQSNTLKVSGSNPGLINAIDDIILFVSFCFFWLAKVGVRILRISIFSPPLWMMLTNVGHVKGRNVF